MVSELNTSPFQWMMNGTGIPSASTWFNGETSQTLVCTNPITSDYNGTYYCSTGSGNCHNIIISEVHPIKLDIHVLLEGAFNGTGMNTQLSNDGLIPLMQPYSGSPWFYPGTESVVSVPANVVDWVLVELRDASSAATADNSTVVNRRAGFLLNNGLLVDIDGVSPLIFPNIVVNNLYVVYRHRNHLDVMTANALVYNNGFYYYDFTSAATQAYGNMQNDLGGGLFGLIAGDANADGTINELDGTEVWVNEVGHTGYLQSDANMDSQADNKDKNDVWVGNYGKFEVLPE